jgi:hypothetical protein
MYVLHAHVYTVFAPHVCIQIYKQTGAEANLAPPYRPSRMLHPGQLRHLFEDTTATSTTSSSSSSSSNSAAEYTVLHDEQAELTTRGVQVPASFFVARRALQ